MHKVTLALPLSLLAIEAVLWGLLSTGETRVVAYNVTPDLDGLQALPVRGHVAVRRGSLGPVCGHGDRVCPDCSVLGCGQQGTCRHGHGSACHHAHGHTIGPGGSNRSWVDGGGNAVGLDNCGVVDDMGLGGIHGLCVVGSLGIQILLGIGTSDWIHGRLIGVG